MHVLINDDLYWKASEEEVRCGLPLNSYGNNVAP